MQNVINFSGAHRGRGRGRYRGRFFLSGIYFDTDSDTDSRPPAPKGSFDSGSPGLGMGDET